MTGLFNHHGKKLSKTADEDDEDEFPNPHSSTKRQTKNLEVIFPLDFTYKGVCTSGTTQQKR